MLLLDLEKQTEKLSKPELRQLFQHIQSLLKDKPDPDMYPALHVPAIDDEFSAGKYDLENMTGAAERLKAALASQKGPDTFDESRMTFIDV